MKQELQMAIIYVEIAYETVPGERIWAVMNKAGIS